MIKEFKGRFCDLKMSGSESLNMEALAKSFLAGGISGMCAKSAVAPLDRIKILLQAQSRHYRHLGVWKGLSKIVSEESVLALYKGNGAQMLRIFPYAALQFASYETYRSTLPGALNLSHESHIVKFVSGSLAGVTAVTMTFPLDTIRARLAFQVAGEHVYTGILDTARTITRDEGGPRGLYRGLSPTLVAMVPYSGLTFYCFEVLKHQVLVLYPTACVSTEEGVSLGVTAKLLCGAVAGGVAQTAAYPLDVTRRRMQLALMQPETVKYAEGLLGTLKLIYREDGVVKGLYRGMSVNYLRAVPMVAVTFSMYELLKQSMGLSTAVKFSTG